jgi:hypothetical protein
VANYQQLIRDEMKYQRERLYKRLKKSDNGRLIVEYWAGAKDFLSGVPGINWEKQGNKILIKEDTNMKSFKDILKDSEPIQEGTLKDYKDEPDNFGDKLDPKAEKILRKL